MADMAKPELAKLIAVEVRRLHGLEIPGSKEPLLWQDIYKFIDKGILSSFLLPVYCQLCLIVSLVTLLQAIKCKISHPKIMDKRKLYLLNWMNT